MQYIQINSISILDNQFVYTGHKSSAQSDILPLQSKPLHSPCMYLATAFITTAMLTDMLRGVALRVGLMPYYLPRGTICPILI